jgi:serine/threonine-protein kinase
MKLLQEGQLIRDTYEVERFLGEGAFAEVYRVKHRFLGRQAMKVFKRVGMSLDEIQNMLGEAIILTHLKHPNIISVSDANVFETKDGACGYFTMEYVPGGSLDKFWRSHGGQFVPIETSIDLIKQICRGISLAHREKPPIIHRDIKPHNILVGYEADGLRARVSDFGLAKSVNPLTLLATAAGTLAFKPPEAFTDQKGDSCSADVWAIGVTLYLLLTDRLPYEMPKDASWTSKNLFNTPVGPPSGINPDVNRDLDAMVMKTLEKKADSRYPTAKEFLIALENWKPASAESTRKPKSMSTEASKSVLGIPTPADEGIAKDLAQKAFKARQAGRLADAADLMEEAFNKSPMLRRQYAHQVKMWRCGVSM